ncbi:MAG TPA: translocation/assembly module TamB domain-containing protein [Kofleriaceae bacterium]|nr:translocation/assembly module TamB domain-containing protein [Kofleriaceae bacterium]
MVLLGSALAVVRVQFEGPDLAQNLCTMMNSRMRGRIEIQSIEWPMSALPKVVSGGWLPVTLKNVAIWDGEGERVVRTEKVTGELDLHSLMFGRHDFVLRKVTMHGGEVVLSEISEPYPLHDYDITVFSIIAAFYGRREAGFHAGVFAATSPLWDLRDFEVRDVDVEIRTKPVGEAYLFRGQVSDVSGRGFFYMDPSDPLVPKFYVSLKLTGGEGQIDLYYERDKTGAWKPKGEYSFPVKSLDVRRLAQLPGGWPTDPVANTLRFDVAVETKNGAKATIDGSMIDYWDTPYGGIWDVTAKVENAGTVLRQSIDPDIGGEAVTLEATVTGPIIFYPSVAIKATGLTYKLSVLEPPLMLKLDALHAVYDLAVDEGSVDEFIARGADGRVRLSAKWGGDGSDRSPYWVDSDIGIDEAIDMTPWMPPTLLRALGSGRLSGSFHALRRKGDTTYGISVDKIDLRLGNMRVDRGQIYLDKSLAKVHVDGVRFTMTNFLGSLKCTILTGGEEIAFDQKDCEAKIESGNVQQLLDLLKAGSKSKARSSKGAKAPPKASLAPRAPAAQPRRALRPMRRGARRLYQAQPAPPPPRRPTTPAKTSGCGSATSGSTTVQIGGSASNLSITSELALRCIPVLGDLRGTITFADGVVNIVSATSRTLGSLRFSGRVQVEPSLYLNPLKVVATKVDLSKIKTVSQVLAGKISASVTMRGPLDPKRMVFEGWACADQVVALGETLGDVAVWLNQKPTSLGCHNKAASAMPRPIVDACLKVGDASNGRCAIVRATREKGGEIAGAISADGKQQLGGQLQISHLPLAALIKLAGAKLEADALIDATALGLGGTVDAPQLSGVVKLSKAWVMGGYLGDGDLAVEPAGPGFVRFSGSFLDGRISLAGTLGTRAPYPLELTADVTQLEADAFVDLKALGAPPNTQVWGTGRVQVKTALGDEKAPLSVMVDLSDLSVVGEAEGPDGQPVPLAVRAISPLQVSWDGTRARLTAPARLSTPMGEISLEGEASPTKLDIAAKGRLDLLKAQPLFGEFFDRTTGTAELTARVTGSAKVPHIQVSLDLDDVALRLAGQDAMLRVPGGRIDFSDGKLSLTGLSVEVDDGYQRSTAPLEVKGGVTFKGLKPTQWAIIVSGELAGEMLLAFAPDTFAQASGTASVSMTLTTGSGGEPRVSGELAFGEGRTLRLLPRALRREIALDRGTISFDGERAADLQIFIEDVGGKIDDEGTLRDVEGTIELKDWKVAAADVVASGDALTFRVQRTLDLVISLDAIRVVLDRGQLEIAGGVELTTGRYTANFDLGETLAPSVPSGPSAPPIWETTPLLGAARLDLQIDVRKFSVVNNLANIDLYGRIAISGTPRDPRFDDTIHVERGTFRIPLVRPRFTRTQGRAEFSSRRRVLDQTPALSITSEADYRDSSGQEHLITLSISGDWPRLTWDLTTSSGLDKSQTLTLILSGRTPEELRRNLGDQALISDPTRIDPSTDNSQGVTDELVRQFASDLLEARFAEPLRQISTLDVARIELNLSSFGFHGEKRLLETTRALGDFERTTRGSSINVRLEQRLPHHNLQVLVNWASGQLSTFAAEAGVLVKRFDDTAERDVTDVEFKGVLRLLFGK